MPRLWYEPYNFAEWFKRAVSAFNLLVIIFTAIIVFSEFRFDWFEKMIGAYLSSTNADRPQTGVVWEAGAQTSKAYQYLNTVIARKEIAQKNANQSESFSDLATRILPGEWVTLEKQEFKTLYLSLQRVAALKIIEPSHLVWLLNDEKLDRIFCEGTDGGLNLYFIDFQNRVIKKIELTAAQLLELEDGIQPIESRLEDIPGFAGRIFSAETFFEQVFKLPSDMIPDLITHPEALLRQEGRITHVGIWNESKNGYIRLGFQLDVNGISMVMFLSGREWAVWQLSLQLKGASVR